MAEHAHTTPTPIARRRAACLAGGPARRLPSSDAGTPPAPLSDPPNARLVYPNLPVEIAFNHPTETGATRVVRGVLIGAMVTGETVHHFRIRDRDDVVWFIPWRWLTPMSLVFADRVGFDLPAEEEARCKPELALYRLQKLRKTVASLRAMGLLRPRSPAEAGA